MIKRESRRVRKCRLCGAESMYLSDGKCPGGCPIDQDIQPAYEPEEECPVCESPGCDGDCSCGYCGVYGCEGECRECDGCGLPEDDCECCADCGYGDCVCDEDEW
jgi:hypothetical protein